MNATTSGKDFFSSFFFDRALTVCPRGESDVLAKEPKIWEMSQMFQYSQIFSRKFQIKSNSKSPDTSFHA